MRGAPDADATRSSARTLAPVTLVSLSYLTVHCATITAWAAVMEVKGNARARQSKVSNRQWPALLRPRVSLTPAGKQYHACVEAWHAAQGQRKTPRA